MLGWLPSQNITTSHSGSRHFPSHVNPISWFEIAVSLLSPISILFSYSEVPGVVPFFTAQLCVNWNKPIYLCTYISFPLHMFLSWFNLLSLYVMPSTFSYVVDFQHHSHCFGYPPLWLWTRTHQKVCEYARVWCSAPQKLVLSSAAHGDIRSN